MWCGFADQYLGIAVAEQIGGRDRSGPLPQSQSRVDEGSVAIADQHLSVVGRVAYHHAQIASVVDVGQRNRGRANSVRAGERQRVGRLERAIAVAEQRVNIVGVPGPALVPGMFPATIRSSLPSLFRSPSAATV